MKQKIILFDWDDTLFSKKIYKNNLLSNLARICGITIEEAVNVDNQYFDNLVKSGDFSLEDYLKRFEDKFDKEIKREDFTTDKLGIYSKALFPEIIEVLEKMKDGSVLGIYSQGFENLQRLKIKFSGIEDYFDKDLIFIDRDKTRPELTDKLPAGATVVDDKKEVIEKLRISRPDLNLIWINRADDNIFEGITTIKNLQELEKII